MDPKLIARAGVLGLSVAGYFYLLATGNPAAAQVQEWLVPLLMSYFAAESLTRLVRNGDQ